MTVRPRVPHWRLLVEFCWDFAWLAFGAGVATWNEGLLRFLGLVVMALSAIAIALLAHKEGA